MKFATICGAALATVLSLPTAASAQHENMPGMAQSSPNAGVCAQNSQSVTRAIGDVNTRIEDARQLNDAARMRAAIADLQLALTQMKAQLTECVALGASAGNAMGSMPGMDHSKMQMGR